MANVTFDKHIEFCEMYMEEVHKTVSTLFRDGPTEVALSHAGRFNDLRQDYAAWITNDINEQLFPFEQALRELGSAKGFINSTTDTPEYAEQRKQAIKAAWDQNGTPLVKGKKVTGFSNSEEEAVGLTEVVPYLLEDQLAALGGLYDKAEDWNPHAVVDGLLITGQNPASSTAVAKALLKAIN